MIMSKIRYKYLYAYDLASGHNFIQIRNNQKEAESDDAPEDAVYKVADGIWCRFKDIQSDDTKTKIQTIVNQIQKSTE